MVKSLIVALRRLKILQKCTKTDLQREEKRELCVCSDLGTEHLLCGFDRNGLQIREIKSMCSEYTVTFDGWNEKQNFSSYFKVLCTFFYYKNRDCNFFVLFSDKCAFKHLKIPIAVREQLDIHHVIPLHWNPYRGFSILLVCFKLK